MYEEYHKIVSFKTGENANLVKVSSIYGFNCSEQDYVEVDDKTLEFLIESNRSIASKERNFRNHCVSLPDEENKAAKMGAVTVSTQESFFSERDDEQINEILSIFAQLSLRQRKRLYMKFRLNMTYTAIGVSEGVSAASILESCERALEKLKKHSEIFQNTNLKTWVDLLI